MLKLTIKNGTLRRIDLKVIFLKKKIIRMTTIAGSMNILLRGQLKFMNQYFEVIGIASDVDPKHIDSVEKYHIKEIQSREGVSFIPVEMRREIDIIQDIKSLIKLLKILKSLNPSIIHTHTPKAGLMGMIAGKILGIPIRMHTIAGMPLMSFRGLIKIVVKLTEKLTYGAATNLYPNSIGLMNYIIENGLTKKEKLKVLANGGSNGIDIKKFTPNEFKQNKNFKNNFKRDIGIKEDELIFVYIGRLHKDKGILELLNAFKVISNEFAAKLLLVGPTDKYTKKSLPQIFETLETHKDIFYVGRRNDVRPYYYISDVLVFPSYREGFPGVVLEAGAMGLPSIVTNINGCNEIIENGVNGLIVEPKNEEQLKDAMIRLYKDKKLRIKLANNSRKVIVEKFSNKIVWEAMKNEYERLLEGLNVKKR